ncbi:alpha/beta family hydrolase [Thalassomonas actiniarum]|uniref:Alpha/beta hydrolase n=1 Tax=Thalassomonas actiniarum TaxID=485447 RepID=A0AAE9YPA3_9GAMM|nr:alpha/beta family hydrolase [Thalassomonas actiniarum]WDD97713.1 alpha/beta hydrolase [Thalassomonas actiniarum]
MTTTKLNAVENPKAMVILAHGAGADMDHGFMEKMTALLNSRQINVLRFNFPYMDKRRVDGKRYPPDRMPKLLDCYREVIRQQSQALPVFLAGKSMGSRVGATLAGEALAQPGQVKGVICLGYPFHPQKKPEKLRLEPLQQTLLPTLIVQGERDALGSKDDIAGYRLSDLCQLVFLPDGDHDLKPRVKSGFSQEQHMQSAADEILRFIDEKS